MVTKKKASKINEKAPKQERSKETVETILSAAIRILSKEGMEGLNTNLIAKVAGVSVGSLYQYFRNKESVVQMLLVRVLDAGLERAEKILEEENEPREVIARLVSSSLKTLADQGPATLYVLEAAPRLLGTKRFEQVDAAMIPKFLTKAREKGIRFRVENAELALFLSIQIVRAAGWSIVRDKGQRFKVEEMSRELTDLLCRYLLPDEAQERKR